MLPSKTSMLAALAFLIAAPVISASAEDTTSRNSLLPLACATRDLQFVTQLEYEVNRQIFDAAFSALMRARQACYQAHVTEGLAMYDRVRTLISGGHVQ